MRTATEYLRKVCHSYKTIPDLMKTGNMGFASVSTRTGEDTYMDTVDEFKGEKAELST